MNDGCSVKSESVTIQMEDIKEYFYVVLFIMLYEVVLTLKSVGFSSPQAALLLISTKNCNL